MLEEDAFFDGEHVRYIDGRQTELMIIPRTLYLPITEALKEGSVISREAFIIFLSGRKDWSNATNPTRLIIPR